MLDVTTAGWLATLGLVAGLFLFDLVRAGLRPHAVGFREALAWSVFYVSVALLFGVAFAVVAGWDLGAQYFAGYIVEKSLSVDNLFVFMIIMSTFAVPPAQQARALTIGIMVALVLRAVFIAVGAALLDAFSFMFAIFGLALLATAVQLFRHRSEDPSVDDNMLVAGARRLLPVTSDYHGGKILTRAGGRRVATPLLLVLIAIGGTDFLFALDSIPAVFGVTQHAYIVFVTNAFALLGLRALFFLVSGLLDRLVYLSTGLALILAFIGVKLILHFAHLHAEGVPEISTAVSLVVIVVVLAAVTVASLIKSSRDPTLRAHAGRLREPRSHADGGDGPVDAEIQVSPHSPRVPDRRGSPSMGSNTRGTRWDR
jgi:tellurite resistance protein TerC